MPVTMNDVLTELDRDEPDYDRAARLGPEALPLLGDILAADDPMRASKAAYLAGLIRDPGAETTLQQAAGHRDARVRVAVAHTLANHEEPSEDLLGRLLDDDDPGVRKLALRSTAARGSARLRDKVSAIADNDPEEHLRTMASGTGDEMDRR